MYGDLPVPADVQIAQNLKAMASSSKTRAREAVPHICCVKFGLLGFGNSVRAVVVIAARSRGSRMMSRFPPRRRTIAKQQPTAMLSTATTSRLYRKFSRIAASTRTWMWWHTLLHASGVQSRSARRAPRRLLLFKQSSLRLSCFKCCVLLWSCWLKKC